MNKKELNKIMKKQFMQLANEEWSRKDRIRGKIWWYIWRHFPPRNKGLRETLKKIKYASKLLRE